MKAPNSSATFGNMIRAISKSLNNKGNLLLASTEALSDRLILGLKKRNYETVFSSEPSEIESYLIDKGINGGIHGLILDSDFHDDIETCFKITELANKHDFDILKTMANLGVESVLEKPVNAEAIDRSFERVWENPNELIQRRNRFFDLSDLTEKEKEIKKEKEKSI